jgi:hypothetical protein
MTDAGYNIVKIYVVTYVVTYIIDVTPEEGAYSPRKPNPHQSTVGPFVQTS